MHGTEEMVPRELAAQHQFGSLENNEVVYQHDRATLVPGDSSHQIISLDFKQSQQLRATGTHAAAGMDANYLHGQPLQMGHAPSTKLQRTGSNLLARPDSKRKAVKRVRVDPHQQQVNQIIKDYKVPTNQLFPTEYKNPS